MAYWDDFYSSVGIGDARSPAEKAAARTNYGPLSPGEVTSIYGGIYPPASVGLTTRPVRTVPVPNPVGYTLSGQAGIGPGGAARGSATYMAPAQPNQPNGSIVAKSGTERLPAMSANADLLTGYAPAGTPSPAVAAIDGATRPAVPSVFPGWGAKLPAFGTKPRGGDIQLQFEPGDVSGQRFADSEGRSFTTPSGKRYTPGGGNGAAPVLGGSAQDMRAAPQAKQGGWMSLLGDLLKGNGTAAPARAPAIGNNPSQGRAMTVDQNTSSGSTLAGMGFSPGAVVPAATIRNLSERGYI